MNPIPVTFHVRAEPRPDLIAAHRNRVRPYRVIVQGVAIFAVMGVGFGYLMSAMVGPQKAGVAMKPAPIATAPVVASAPAPSFPVWQPSMSTPANVAYEPAKASDRTPVATIPDTRPDASPAAPARPSRGFAPIERAPDYSGFKVTAGH